MFFFFSDFDFECRVGGFSFCFRRRKARWDSSFVGGCFLGDGDVWIGGGGGFSCSCSFHMCASFKRLKK